MASRLAATNIAARLGVFSNEALVDFYSRLVEDESAPEAATEKAQAMRTAYVGNDVAQRLEAMQRFWFQEGADRPDSAGYVAMARAAARMPVKIGRASGRDRVGHTWRSRWSALP